MEALRIGNAKNSYRCKVDIEISFRTVSLREARESVAYLKEIGKEMKLDGFSFKREIKPNNGKR